MELGRRASSPPYSGGEFFLAAMSEWTSLGERMDTHRRLSRLRSRHAYHAEATRRASQAASSSSVPEDAAHPFTPQPVSAATKASPERVAARRELRKRRCTHSRTYVESARRVVLRYMTQNAVRRSLVIPGLAQLRGVAADHAYIGGSDDELSMSSTMSWDALPDRVDSLAMFYIGEDDNEGSMPVEPGKPRSLSWPRRAPRKYRPHVDIERFTSGPRPAREQLNSARGLRDGPRFPLLGEDELLLDPDEKIPEMASRPDHGASGMSTDISTDMGYRRTSTVEEYPSPVEQGALQKQSTQ